MNDTFKKFIIIFFLVILSGFNIINHDVLIINSVIFVIVIGFIIFYKINKKIVNSEDYINLKLLKYTSIFYVVYNDKHEIIFIDRRHNAIKDFLEEDNVEFFLNNVLNSFKIQESNINTIIANLYQDFEMRFDYELENLSYDRYSIKNFNVVNFRNILSSKKENIIKEKNLNLLMILNNYHQDLVDLCDHFKFPFVTLNDKLEKVTINSYFSKIKSSIDLDKISKLLSDKCLSKSSTVFNKQDNFLYETENGEKFDIYKITDLIWSIKYGKSEEYFNLVISQENKIEANKSYFWDLYCKNNSIPIAQLNEEFEISESNSAFNNLVQFNKERGIKLTDYLECNDGDENFRSRLDFENSIVVHVLFKFNKRNSAFAYIQKISYLNEIIIYLIDNTKQKDLELSIIHSQKMQAIGQLAGGIAHDFNNLLTAMLGFCDLLLCKHPAGDSSFPELMQIKQNIIRAINLVRNLLAFSRKQILEVRLIDVNEVILNILDLLRRLIGENIALKTFYSQDLGCIRVDQGQLEQVIINLVVNARDALVDGGEINIRTYRTLVSCGDNGINSDSNVRNADSDKIEDGEYIVIEVEDNGCGIDEVFQDKIFEPFYSTKEIGSGTGLGLSMAYGIVKQSEGYIYFSSKENHGSVFYLFFKRVDENDTDKKINTNDFIEKSLPDPRLNLDENHIVLLVEDEDSVRLFAMHALKSRGYIVFSAKSGNEALEVMKNISDKIDLVVTDVIMPGISGYQLAEKIKEMDIHKMAKVLFVSGYTEDRLVRQLKNDNSNYDFLSKPFNLKELIAKVGEMLDN